MKNLKRGFTLIELLVVIAIIGILSSVVLASLNSARAKSRDAKRLSDIKSLQLALELYFDQNKEYPEAVLVSDSDADLVPDYIGQEPKDPLGANYVYEVCGIDNDSFHLGTSLEQKSSALNDDADGKNTCGTWGGGDDIRTGTPCDDSGNQGSYCYDVTD